MYGIITHDEITWDNGDDKKGKVFGDPQTFVGDEARVWRLLDDDRVPYYYGIADDDCLETIFEWAMPDAGTTILQVLNPVTLQWKDEMN